MNGLMIAAYAKAGFYFDNDVYISRAEEAACFLFSNLEIEPSSKSSSQLRLYHRYRDDESGIEGMLDDYMFLTKGLIELFQATGRINYLEKAISFMRTTCDQFWDKQKYGFFMNSNDSDTLIARPKEFFDGALPSGNSVALSNLYKLYKLTGDLKWKSYADQLIQAVSSFVSVAASSFTALLSSLYYEFTPGYEIVIVYPPSQKGLKEMLNVLRHSGIFQYTLLLKEGDHKSSKQNGSLDQLAPYTKSMKVQNGTATVYLCKDHTCQKPIIRVEEFQKKIDEA